MKLRLYFLGICFLLTAFVVSAGATTLTTKGYYGYGYGVWTYNSLNQSGNRAMLRAEIDLNDDLTADFTSPAFCVEKEAYINIYDTTYNATLLTLNQASNGEIFKVAWLMDTYSDTSNWTQMGALQFAIWHVLYDGNIGFDLTGGSTLSLYNTMLTTLAGFDDNGNGDYGYLSNIYRIAQLTDADGANIQDLIIKVNPVPEPATMALFSLGLLGIALVGRKRS